MNIIVCELREGSVELNIVVFCYSGPASRAGQGQCGPLKFEPQSESVREAYPVRDNGPDGSSSGHHKSMGRNRRRRFVCFS